MAYFVEYNFVRMAYFVKYYFVRMAYFVNYYFVRMALYDFDYLKVQNKSPILCNTVPDPGFFNFESRSRS